MSKIESKRRGLIDQAILLGFASVVFVCLRILSISRGNLVLAETLVSNLDPLKIFISSMIPLTNIVCLLLGLFILNWNRLTHEHLDQRYRALTKAPTKVLAILLVFIGIIFVNLMMLIGVLLVYLVHIVRKNFLHRKFHSGPDTGKDKLLGDAFYFDVSLFVAAVFVFYTLFVPTMWVPTENMYVKSAITGNHDTLKEKSPITVYVVSENPNYLTTVDAFTMVPEIYRTEDVLGRQICTEDKKMLIGSLLSWTIANWNSKTLGRGWTCAYPSNISLFGKHFNFTF